MNGHLKDDEREEVVKYLVYLLRSPEFIEKHLIVEFFQRQCWTNDEDLSIIGMWLRNDNAWGKLKRKESIWVKQAVSITEFLAPALKDIAAMVARHWLCHRTWSAELPYQWLDVFLDHWAIGTAQNQIVDGTNSGSDIKDSDGKTTNIAIEEDLPQGVLSVSTRIVRAAEWAENIVGIPKDSLWYERLGNTYLHHGETDLSIKAFLNARELPECSWRICEGLADAYARNENPVLALQEMEVILAHLRGKQDRTATERDELVKNLVKAATWQRGNSIDAINKLREAMRLDEYDYHSHYELLDIFIRTGQESEALQLLSEMRTRSAREGSVTQLEAMLVDFSKWNNTLENFSVVLYPARHHDIFQTVLEIIERAIASARERKADQVLSDLLLCQGVALAWHSSEENSYESALARWTEGHLLGLESNMLYSAQLAAGYVFKYYFSQIRSKQLAAHEIENYMEKFKAMVESTNNPDVATELRLRLACLYRLLDQDNAMRNLLLKDMKNGFDLLSDDDPENDYMGYATIGKIMMSTGDDLNALSAWSLWGPDERRREYLPEGTRDGKEVDSQSNDTSPSENGIERFSPIHCDGHCSGWHFRWGDTFWMCKLCDDVAFNDECLDKLRKGTLARFVCSPDHDWLLIPSWADEYRATGKGRVRMGGELIDGKRVGGQIVPVEEWLDTVREKWGIDKPVLTAQTDSEKAKQ